MSRDLFFHGAVGSRASVRADIESRVDFEISVREKYARVGTAGSARRGTQCGGQGGVRNCNARDFKRNVVSHQLSSDDQRMELVDTAFRPIKFRPIPGILYYKPCAPDQVQKHQAMTLLVTVTSGGEVWEPVNQSNLQAGSEFVDWKTLTRSFRPFGVLRIHSSRNPSETNQLYDLGPAPNVEPLERLERFERLELLEPFKILKRIDTPRR